MMERQQAVGRFYKILQHNIAKRGGRYELSALFSSRSLYSNPELNHAGVYFIFEPNEFREDSVTPRVVYVGKAKGLFIRLERHSRDRDSSSFAGNVFAAVAKAAGRGDGFTPFLKEYWRDIPDGRYGEMRAFEFDLVLPVIRKMSFTWLPVSSTDQRQRLEEGAIALLSNFPRADLGSAIDPSSPTWLGRTMNSKPRISESGLWNNNKDVKCELGDGAWLDEFEALVAGRGLPIED
jgi:hypothetical protein